MLNVFHAGLDSELQDETTASESYRRTSHSKIIMIHFTYMYTLLYWPTESFVWQVVFVKEFIMWTTYRV